MAESIDPGLDVKPETVRGTPGFYRVAQTGAGLWWFVDPDNGLYFFRGVNAVDGLEGSPHDPVARLRTWGFNALGADCQPVLRDEGLPFVACVDFAEVGATIRLGGARLPDVFDPEWPKAAALRAGQVCFQLSGRRELIGWISDNCPGWAQPTGGSRPALLQICLSLEPSFAAYHAAWEFVLALHRGRLDSLARAWGQPIGNKEVIREMTRAEHGIGTRGYLRDDARWSQEFARRYFALTSAAIRAVDANHLLFGCRFGERASAAVLAECNHAVVDVPWIDLDEVALISPGPVIAGDFTWVDPRFLGVFPARRPRGLTSVERMLRRGRVVLERLARHPPVAGYAWSRWRDTAGEQPPFAGGLVHVNDGEALEHTELLADINARVAALRGSAASSGTLTVS